MPSKGLGATSAVSTPTGSLKIKLLAHLGDCIAFRVADTRSMRLARAMTSTLVLTVALLVGLGMNQINEADKAKKQ